MPIPDPTEGNAMTFKPQPDSRSVGNTMTLSPSTTASLRSFVTQAQ
jgi:hypothetical protein